jgi:hypothetical protein
MSHLAKRLLIVALPAIALASASASTSIASAGTSASARLGSCSGQLLFKPTGTVVLACADANTEIKATKWTSWTNSGASGTTDFGLNLCTPTCVASRISFFPGATIRLSAPKHTAHGLLFTRAVIGYRLHGEQKTFTAYPAT